MTTLARVFAQAAWGDVPTWVGLVGVALAATTYMASRWAQGRTTAAHGFAWADTFELPMDYDDDGTIRYAPFGEIVVRNNGTEPIFDVDVRLVAQPNAEADYFRCWVTLVPPHEESKPLPAPARGDAQAYPRPLVRLRFTDGRGRRWERDEYQRIRRVDVLRRHWHLPMLDD